MTRSRKLACLLALLGCQSLACGQAQRADPQPGLADAIDWAPVLSQFDPVWSRSPNAWDEAPFLGNGEQGTLLYQLNDKTLRWDVGCSAAHDHRAHADDDLTEKNVTILNRGRHFIGRLEISTPVPMTAFVGRLSLWNADASGTVSAQGGSLRYRALVHATDPVMYFELDAKGRLAGSRFEYVPELARNPRAVRAKSLRKPANPPPEIGRTEDGIRTAVHQLVSGGQTAVAWRQTRSGGREQVWLSVKHSYPGDGAREQAVEAVRSASAANLREWVANHRAWWRNYYPSSFVSTGDPYWDSFYWVQQYKLACATRDRGWIIDNQGPWLQPTAWNGVWWNLNAQLSHSVGFVANRRSTVSALSHQLDRLRDNLALNAPEPYRHDSYALGRTSSGWDLLGHAGMPGGREPMDPNIGRECGNLLWALHNVDLECRYWRDERLRDEVLYPLLVRAVNYYLHFLVKEDDGLLHLPETYSPEYRRAADCTYDIDLLRWATRRLLELADEKGLELSREPLIRTWRETEAKLVPAHVDKTGRMIGRGVALTGGHRHWSHLLAVYPLRTLTPTNPQDRRLISRSLKHWHSFGRGIAGYSFTGASCMASILGEGDEALRYLNELRRYLRPNTFYSEIGLPVMETPLHGATAIQEMLLQSWGGRVRVFPAVPSAWPDARFANLRADGGVLVSAARESGKTAWVHVYSEAGGRVEVDPSIPAAQWTESPDVAVERSDDGVVSLLLKPGSGVLFWPEGDPQPDATIRPVPFRKAPHRFGLP